MFTIRIADTVIQIDNQYQFIEDYCRNYIIKDVPPDITVAVNEAEIVAEMGKYCCQSMDYLETLAVYRKICEKLIDRDIVLFHSSALMIEGKAVLFSAPSGTGKSTHARIWRETFGERVTMINDDKPLISIGRTEVKTVGRADDTTAGGADNITIGRVPVRVYGTPWCGKHSLENNISAPLSAVFWLKQGKDNSVVGLDDRSAFAHILNQIYRPNDEVLMRKTIMLAGRLLENVEFFEITCNMEKEAAITAYNAVFGK